ncbi:MAG: hypothetical protein U1A27_09610 [Phycisphaerae bacterium]
MSNPGSSPPAAAPLTAQFAPTEYECWTVEDYARRRVARGHRVHRHAGTWWDQVGTAFCWPLDPLAVLPPRGVRPAWTKSPAGYQHRVAEAAAANSYLNLMLLEDVPHYAIERLDSKRRNLVRKGLKGLAVRTPSVEEYRRDGLRVEQEFHERTRWKSPPAAAEWPAYVDFSYRDPVIDHKLAAFAGERIVGLLTWFGLERTAFVTHISSAHDGLKLCANDALLFTWASLLRDSGQYDRACFWLRSAKPSLDQFKAEHLFKPTALAARLVLNPVARLIAARWKPQHLERLHGLDEAGIRAWLERKSDGAADAPPAAPSA